LGGGGVGGRLFRVVGGEEGCVGNPHCWAGLEGGSAQKKHGGGVCSGGGVAKKKKKRGQCGEGEGVSETSVVGQNRKKKIKKLSSRIRCVKPKTRRFGEKGWQKISQTSQSIKNNNGKSRDDWIKKTRGGKGPPKTTKGRGKVLRLYGRLDAWRIKKKQKEDAQKKRQIKGKKGRRKKWGLFKEKAGLKTLRTCLALRRL